MTSHHFCHIPLVWSKSQVPLQSKGISKCMDTRRWGSWWGHLHSLSTISSVLLQSPSKGGKKACRWIWRLFFWSTHPNTTEPWSLPCWGSRVMYKLESSPQVRADSEFQHVLCQPWRMIETDQWEGKRKGGFASAIRRGRGAEILTVSSRESKDSLFTTNTNQHDV